jgi:hypothetical protein
MHSSRTKIHTTAGPVVVLAALAAEVPRLCAAAEATTAAAAAAPAARATAVHAVVGHPLHPRRDLCEHTLSEETKLLGSTVLGLGRGQAWPNKTAQSPGSRSPSTRSACSRQESDEGSNACKVSTVPPGWPPEARPAADGQCSCSSTPRRATSRHPCCQRAPCGQSGARTGRCPSAGQS